MQLHGIATALYDSGEKTIVSVAALNSNSANDIFIVNSQKVQVNPSKPAEVRDAFKSVMDKMLRQPVQRGVIQQGPNKGFEAVIPVEVIYGAPFKHPAEAYRSMLLSAFPMYFKNRKKARNAPVDKLLMGIFKAYYEEHCHPDSMIVLNRYHLFLPDNKELLKAPVITEEDERANVEYLKLYKAAEAGSEEARIVLEICARKVARALTEKFEEDGTYDATRFIQYGPNNESYRRLLKYTFLNWFDLKNVFVDEFIKNMKNPYYVCVKTPNDKPAPPFADICATYLADQWSILEGGNKPKHAYARQLDIAA